LLRRSAVGVASKRNLSFFGNIFKFAPDEFIYLYGEKADPKVFRLMKAYGDKEYGGGSHSTVKVVPKSESDSGETFIRWAGVKNFDGEHALKTKARGGYVAYKMVCNDPVDVMDLDGFFVEMRVKTDLLLTVNMRCLRTLDMVSTHQNNIFLTGGSDWQKFFIPFDKLIGTYDGVEKDENQENDSLQLASFGFVMNSDTWVPGQLFSLLYHLSECLTWAIYYHIRWSCQPLYVTMYFHQLERAGEFEVDIKSLTVSTVDKLAELNGGKAPLMHK